MSDHEPNGAAWICAGCGADWPCATRRKQLRAEFAGSRMSLRVYLGHVLVIAADDLRHVPAGWLHNRFVGWVEPGPLPYTSVEILQRSYELANAHQPDEHGRCPACGDPADCWVRLSPDGPGFLIPVP